MSDKDQNIRERTHQIWEHAGRLEGNEADHWHQAERKLHNEAGGAGEAPSRITSRA